MRLPGEYEYSNSGLSMKYMTMGVCLCLMLIFGVVLWTNKENDAKKHKEQETSVMVLEHEADGVENAGGQDNAKAAAHAESGSAKTENASAAAPAAGAIMGFNGAKTLEEVERLYAEGKLVASDLDFWDMYPKTTPAYMSGASAQEGNDRGQGSSGMGTGTGTGGSGSQKDKYARYDEEAEREQQKEAEKEEQDPSKDGKHTCKRRGRVGAAQS